MTIIDVSNGPFDNPRKYEVIVDDFHGKPRGETIVLDPEHPLICEGLDTGALRLMNEPASEDGNGDN